MTDALPTRGRAWFHGACLAGLCFFLTGLASAQLPGLPQARRDAVVEQCRQIGMMLFSYATDHLDAPFPEGKSSTEVFQKLLDGSYCTDPAVFYVALPGKSKAPAGQKLKPENVCFDVTSAPDSDAPDGLPIVFLTGFKVTYAHGGSAVPLANPGPPAMIVFYKNNSARALFPTPGAIPAGSISNFLPSDFDSRGKTYVQLTPDGPMVP